MASLLLAAPAAQAGYYTVAYSGGGTVTATGNNPNLSQYATGSGYCATGSAGVNNGRDSGGSSATINSSPAITATFTWTHDNVTQTDTTDPPPPAAIVQETSEATWYLDSGTTGSGSANSGLPGAVTATASPGDTSFNVYYSAGAGGDSFSVSDCTPSASFSGTSGSVSVQYGADAYPVTIIPNGATQDSTTGAYSLLTGQQVSTGLTGVPFTPGTGSTYTWSVGGDTFYTYNEKAPSHQLVLLSDDPSYTTSPGFSFYDKSAETVTITCKAVLVCPDKSTLTINPSSQPINVLKPSVTKWGYSEGYVQPKVNDNGQTYGLYQDPSTSYPFGMTWHDVAVTVPAPFSGGQCDFAQLVEPDLEEYHGNTSNPINNDPNNGLIGLDGALPYSTGGYGSGWTPPATGGNGDSPQLVANGNRNNDTQLSANETFTTWIIYKPAGGVWVPLQKYSWTWSEQLTWSGNQWNITAAFPMTAGAGPNYTPQDTTDPPQWNLVH